MDLSSLGQFWLSEAAAANAISAKTILQEQKQRRQTAAGMASEHDGLQP
jgi:hypothetical protein